MQDLSDRVKDKNVYTKDITQAFSHKVKKIKHFNFALLSQCVSD